MTTFTGIIEFDPADDRDHLSAFTPEAVAGLVGQEVTLTECMSYARPLASTLVDAATLDARGLTLTLAIERSVWGHDVPEWLAPDAEPAPLSMGYRWDGPEAAPVRLLQLAHTTPLKPVIPAEEQASA